VTAASATTERVLLTGFEPFVPGLDVNPSWEIVRPLDGAVLPRGERRPAAIRVRSVRLPVAYGIAAAKLAEAVASFEPHGILCFGMGRGSSVKIERRYRFAGRDGERLEPGEPPAREALLPVEAILRALESRGFAACASDDAGLYVCEHTGFTATGLARRLGLRFAGLVHVPPPDLLPIEGQAAIPLAILSALYPPCAAEPRLRDDDLPDVRDLARSLDGGGDGLG